MGKMYVANENKLGYIVGKSSDESLSVSMVVLAVDVSAGGDPLLIGHRVCTLKEQMREARQEDEDRFLVRISN